MRTTRVRRLTALMLAFLLLFGTTFAVSANSSGNNEDSTLSSIKELLNAISYDEYRSLDRFKEADKNSGSELSPIVVAGASGTFNDESGMPVEIGEIVTVDKNKYATEKEAWNAAVGDGTKPYVVEVDGKQGIYLPDAGTVTWNVEGITKPVLYSLEIEYYPVVNKAASIERVLMINGEVPFAEARYLNMSKVWTTPYSYAMLEIGKKDNSNAILNEAKNAGFEDVEKLTKDGTTFIKCKSPEVWTDAMSAFVNKYALRFFNADIDNNEIREALQQTPEWCTYTVKDSNGFTQMPFEFVIAPDENGDVTISIEGVNEPVVISNVTLSPCEDYLSYADYQKQYEGQEKGDGIVKIESEYYTAVSDQTIYAASDTTSAANSPVSADKTYLNVLGGNKWQNVGQWIEYDFSVSSSGMYNILMRYKQNILDGMSVCRTLYIYSDDTVKPGELGYYNGIPFEEAANLKYGFSDDWKVGAVSDEVSQKSDETDGFEFYFKKGVNYTLRFEVSLGSMGDIVRRVQNVLDSINADYLSILKLTGTSPDEFADYNFYNRIPQTMADLYDQYEALGKKDKDGNYVKGTILYDIINDAGTKSSMTATLENIAALLEEMSTDEEEVAKNLAQLKTYIGSLGTWLGDAKTQPLLIDYILIQSSEQEVPKAKAGFFEALWHELTSFIQSFFRNYDRMGALSEKATEENVEVWLAYGRDQSQVIRSLINNGFSKESGITVNLKLVAGGTLLPSILSGQGPDVYLGLPAGEVINYAIRGALEPLEKMEGYDELRSGDVFTDEAMMVLEIADADNVMHGYGLPETQNFAMMYVREDILADLDLEVPKTWDDVRAAIPILQANNMEIAMLNDCGIFIYQMGGELFADGGMRINLDSKLALDAFNDMCEMYTMYSFPYIYNFPNRFRTGEMPIGFADYTATYNQLKVFATEIEGLWSFYPLPGIADEDGNINNDAVATVTALVMINGCEQKKNAWEFMKWYVGEECQIDYSNEMVAILGPSAKHPTANRDALESLPWTHDEYKQIEAQFENLAAVPNYPGAYIVARYVNFAFLDAYNNNQNPAESLNKYISEINDEITRKRDEFGLETLDKEQGDSTLAQKRMREANELLEEIKDSNKYSSKYDAIYNSIAKELRDYDTEDYAALEVLADQLEEQNATLFKDAAKKLREAAVCLKSYEAYK